MGVSKVADKALQLRDSSMHDWRMVVDLFVRHNLLLLESHLVLLAGSTANVRGLLFDPLISCTSCVIVRPL
ncbi:hypothetical protein FGO68_gene13580 [Halteria grandinella]|uniref:Uncharacterized protein n=1 Tax=Halteria grandinella TaxID=5974 RepID=A0A8J8T8M7_HALGN|nr:hypothetical protein FGO68_gene13580 [Halteria grandinella]